MTENVDADHAAAAADHAAKMSRRKVARDRILAEKTIERGLIIVHTGAGKGKSTAAFGLAVRALGQGMRVGIVQFVKGAWSNGERRLFEYLATALDDLNADWDGGDLDADDGNFGSISLEILGEGFTWETQDRGRDRQAAERGWEAAKRLLTDPFCEMVILDELNIVLRDDLLPLADVLAVLQARPPNQHVVITGRNAKPELLSVADLVTEMTLIKHPFRSGVKAQRGVEF
ncbi:MAG: cob(I)yrinic acid a,c-diamide adenosyltransferase [Candidatus Symbiobacter sp.]|nr:cob(I)yrinic acid a,c-diamide adenosyltransferase [Candidatus Symbiobacter sp.]